MTGGGIFPAIYGTVVMTLLMTVAVLPVGVATAVYLHEYASPRLEAGARRCGSRSPTWPACRRSSSASSASASSSSSSAAGIDRILSEPGVLHYGQPALIWAALTLAVLTLPVVIVATEEALRAVPRELREASLALGATKLQTIARVVLPQALPGILTGAILAVARGAGEVAPILFTGVAYFLPYLPTAFSTSSCTSATTSTCWPPSRRTWRPPGRCSTPRCWCCCSLTFALNLVAITIRTRTRRKAEGAH